MSRETDPRCRGIRSAAGRINSRLLLNATADPSEVATPLPDGIRPHDLPDGTTVVGCCLLEISDLRSNALPALAGVRVRAAAHRISVEWGDATGETQVGVYVPMRHTDSRLAAALGGRWFPGVHQHARIEVARTETHLDWHVGDLDTDSGFGLQVRVETNTAMIDPTPLFCSTCVDPTLGLSPDHHGRLEAARMAPDGRNVRAVQVDELRSTFLDGFESDGAEAAA